MKIALLVSLSLMPDATRFLALAAAFLVQSLGSAALEKAPNIVLLLADDLGFADLRCYGSPHTQTPNLDRLAAEGIRFTDFYAACAVCSPSRAALLTGRFSVRTGLYSWIHSSHRMHLRRAETTIAKLLKGAGYATAHIGKWHLGYQLENGSGEQPSPGGHGFDHWMATGNNALPSHRNPTNFVLNGVRVNKTQGYSCQLVVDQASDWLDHHRDPQKPFFLNVWFHEPHARVAAPHTFASRHRATSNPEYYGCIENMDHAVGRLIEKIQQMGIHDETLILFTSDNGSYMKGSNAPLRGRKTQLWEGGIRVPGIIKWPGMIEPGSVSMEPVGLVDILPTICRAANLSPPQDRVHDGVDLSPLFRGERLSRNKPLYWFYHPSRPACVIRDGDWCLTADPVINLSRKNLFLEKDIGLIKKTTLAGFQLFNLRTDAGQTTDRSLEEPERLNQMITVMNSLHHEIMEDAYDWRHGNGL